MRLLQMDLPVMEKTIHDYDNYLPLCLLLAPETSLSIRGLIHSIMRS